MGGKTERRFTLLNVPKKAARRKLQKKTGAAV
jgi:hypothetical protein